MIIKIRIKRIIVLDYTRKERRKAQRVRRNFGLSETSDDMIIGVDGKDREIDRAEKWEQDIMETEIKV